MNPIEVRAATADDAAQVVPLLLEAMDHLALRLADVDTRAAAAPFFHALFVAGGNRYGHDHVLVLQRAGEVAAALLAYPGREEAALAASVFAARRAIGIDDGYALEPESTHEEFYLDALAVAPSHRGVGLAAQLIEAGCARARATGHRRAGLLVDLDKPGVKRLYGQLGFEVDGERWLAGHRYEHMSRRLTI